MKYKDLFIDFDDTLYDTYGNSVISLCETYEAYHLDRYFDAPQVFYDASGPAIQRERLPALISS